MVKTSSIKFDVETAKTRAESRFGPLGEVGIRRWAAHADVSTVSLRAWLKGDSGIKIKTVDKILKPLGLTAADLIQSNGKKTA